jgi:peptide deformylase
MFETMYAAPGIASPPTQVDFHKRLIVMDVSEAKTSRWCSATRKSSCRGGGRDRRGLPVGPRHFRRGESVPAHESRPGQDAAGKTFDWTWMASPPSAAARDGSPRGKLFVDYLSDLKRERIRKKLEKDRKDAPRARANPPRARLLIRSPAAGPRTLR